MDVYVDMPEDTQILSTLDANSDYLQIWTYKSNKEKTALSSNHVFYRSTCTTLGLKNADATFQRVVDNILSPIKWQLAFVYLDDTVIFSETTRQLINHTGFVISLFKEACVILTLKRCTYLQMRSIILVMLLVQVDLKLQTIALSHYER